MDYKKHYKRLCERAQERGTRKQDLPFYTEKHRILPGCMGGTYRKDNVALLTPEEHYVAHQLLVKMYPDDYDLAHAAHMTIVASQNQLDRSANKYYGWIKRRYAAECKKRVGDKNPSYGKSWYYNPETLESGKFVECPDGWVKGRVINFEKKHCLECKSLIGLKSKTYSKYCSAYCRKKYVYQINNDDGTNKIPKRYHALRKTIQFVLKVDDPTWDEFYSLKELMKCHLEHDKMTPKQIKNYYGIEYSDYGMFLKLTLNLEIPLRE